MDRNGVLSLAFICIDLLRHPPELLDPARMLLPLDLALLPTMRVEQRPPCAWRRF
ncbi:hypothetical protein glysoja_040955 [Glycine soja]|uniref:Uncharacterized protein n=1 Tax=Glycine soja TaxID=3848 RepID=A0A0B2SI58_GLYSO|nr:hypothetical protein glysoja_040955 [Glycine soja]